MNPQNPQQLQKPLKVDCHSWRLGSCQMVILTSGNDYQLSLHFKLENSSSHFFIFNFLAMFTVNSAIFCCKSKVNLQRDTVLKQIKADHFFCPDKLHRESSMQAFLRSLSFTVTSQFHRDPQKWNIKYIFCDLL